MIRSEKEHQKALNRLEEEQKVIERQNAHFVEMDYSGEELERLMQPLFSFHNQLKEEVETYDGLKKDW
ncbi:hypothetical protein [Rhodohalobacter sp.]|uniref:hypothetical protein n=1 Tax=Rhodohalobacter sp. TaxID=1974210 RepID=UPI002ACE4679|nr:hypothetical protein [Rhodohalobacter sp.]MDZ7757635.1 hypothetical protein [Rhodohalobacter sp.]